MANNNHLKCSFNGEQNLELSPKEKFFINAAVFCAQVFVTVLLYALIR